MKYRLCLCILFVIGCKEKPADEKPLPANLDTVRRDVVQHVNPSIAEPENPVTDSLTLDSLLVAVLKLANENKSKSAFRGQIGKYDPNARNIYATYHFDTLFERSRKHLLVHRLINGVTANFLLYSDIYLLANNQLRKVAANSADLGYTGDTLQDTNGDGFKDYMIHLYSGVGCCPRDDRYGYL